MMDALIGKSILHYTIIEQIGQGGMGVVYKAEDTRLKRHVALKFLPADLTRDDESVDRFINEAQLASSLDHANICTIYEINETSDGQLFICMAYYEGETLARKLERGHLPVEQAIDIIGQIAWGLERVHEAGVTHRDLKPTNIIITNRGEVKILDFGIAKLAGVSRLTKTGTTLGTLAYMSPEQVQKQKVDHRTDIWSLGVVLYEMLTGKLPFQADCEAAMIYAIVNENPEPIVNYGQEFSVGIQRILGKALDKNPGTRYQQVSEFLEDLKLERAGEHELIRPALKVKSRKSARSLAQFASYILAAVLVLFLIHSILTRQSPDRILPTYKQITFRGDANSPAISPDGQFLAYTVGKTGDQKLMVQDLSNGQTLEVLSGNKAIATPVWSPNGSELAFRGQINESSAETYIVPRLGGKARNISVAAFFSWSPDGAYIAHANANWKGIQIKDTENYNFIAAISAYGSYNFNYDIKWSPLSDRFLYVTTGDDGFKIWTMKIDGSEKQIVVKDGYQLLSPCWSANGKAIYYFRTIGRIKQLMKVNITTSGKAVNEPEILQDGLETGDSFTISKDNKRLFYARQLRYSNLMHLSLDGKSSGKSMQAEQLTFGTRAHFAPDISPDGKTIAFSLANEQEANIFIMPIDGGHQQQLTFMKSYNSRPCWSPDGNEIAFASRQQNSIKVWKVSAVGGTPQAFNDSQMSEEFDLTWNPGNFILYQRPDKRNFYKLDPTTEEESPLVQNEGVGWVWNPRFSPDGSYVALNWVLQFDTAESGIWLVSIDQSSQKLLKKGLEYPKPIVWSNDGNWIYALSSENVPNEVVKINVKSGEMKSIVTLPVDEIDGITMTPDGKHLVYASVEIQSDIWQMEHFDPENELEQPIKIPDSPEYQQIAYLQKGAEYRRQQKYAEAEQVYREGLDLNPRNLELMDMLGMTLTNQKKYIEAEQIYRAGLVKDPTNQGFLDNIGFNLLRQLKYDEAEKYFFEGLKQDPVDPTCMHGLITLNIETKNYNAAQRYAEKWLEQSSPRSRSYRCLLLSRISMLQKNQIMVKHYLEQSLVADSTYSAAYAGLGYLFVDQEQFDQAKHFAQKAVSLDSSFANQNLLAWILVTGEFDVDSGIAIAEKALGSKPEDWAHTASIYPYYAIPEHTVGLGYLKKGDYEKAVQYLEQAVELAPERESIKSDLLLARTNLRLRQN